MTTAFNDFRIAVTGGTSALGLALVRQLAGQRARVAFVARTARVVERTSKEMGACGIVGDVGRRADNHAIALQITGNLGGLDVLINKASSRGLMPLVFLADTDREDLHQPGEHHFELLRAFADDDVLTCLHDSRGARLQRPRVRRLHAD